MDDATKVEILTQLGFKSPSLAADRVSTSVVISFHNFLPDSIVVHQTDPRCGEDLLPPPEKDKGGITSTNKLAITCPLVRPTHAFRHVLVSFLRRWPFHSFLRHGSLPQVIVTLSIKHHHQPVSPHATPHRQVNHSLRPRDPSLPHSLAQRLSGVKDRWSTIPPAFLRCFSPLAI